MQMQGVVYEGRKGSSPEKAMFARPGREAEQLESVGSDLRKAVQQLRPTALIGAAAVRGAFSREVLSQLSQVHPTSAMPFAADPRPLPVMTALVGTAARYETFCSQILRQLEPVGKAVQQQH